MNKRIYEMDRKPVIIWTPWGEQKLDRDESARSRFRRRLELRRERRRQKQAGAKAGSTQN